MGVPAAKMGDQVLATDIHIILVPAPPGPPVPTPIPHPFVGKIMSNCSPNVMIMGQPAATLGSIAINTPPHIPLAPGPFQIPPTNQGVIMMGSPTVFINNKPAARMGDPATTCGDPPVPGGGKVVAVGTVMIG